METIGILLFVGIFVYWILRIKNTIMTKEQNEYEIKRDKLIDEIKDNLRE